MPYFLQKVKGNKYFVVDTSGKQYSKKPLSKLRAEKQKTALHINTGHGLYGGIAIKMDKTPNSLGHYPIRDLSGNFIDLGISQQDAAAKLSK